MSSEDYEIVEDVALTDLLPSCEVVKTGELVANYTEKKAELQKYMDTRYKNLVVDESTISEIKKDLAELRRIDKQIEEGIKKAKADFDKPIELTMQQAKELRSIVTDTIADLAAKQKEVDARLQEKNLSNNKALMDMIVSQEEPDIQAFVKDCPWIVKPQWKNKTYTQSQVRNDVAQAIDHIKFALEVFTGKYRAQAIDQYKQSGDLSQAQSFVRRMEDADKRQAEFEAQQAAHRAVPRPEPKQVQEPVAPKESIVSSTAPDDPFYMRVDDMETVTVTSPMAYMQTPADQQIKTVNWKITGPMGALVWLTEMINMVLPDTTYTIITQDMVLSAAEKIRQKRNHSNTTGKEN